MKKNILIFLLFCLITIFLIFNANAQPADKKTEIKTSPSEVKTPLDPLKEDILSFFQPVRGKITQIENMSIKISFDSKVPVRKGMRLQAFKEGSDFIHPVTKERLGKIEIPIGSVEILSISPDYAAGKIIMGNTADFKDAMVKIPAIKTRTLFYQGNTDWFVGDSYYQMLKESGRFEIIDTGIETTDISKILSEAKAKNASIALIMSSERQDKSLVITQRIFWTDDSSQFSEKNVDVDNAYVKELRAKSGLPGMKAVEMLFSYDLPFTANRIIAGDFAGDRGMNIALVSGDTIRFYTSQVDLNLLWQLKLPLKGDIIWIDKSDVNRNGREEILITAWQGNEIVSYIYELKGSEFIKLWSAENIFIRGYGDKILGQAYSSSDGYEGNVFQIIFSDNTFKKGEKLKLPLNLNVYDFQEIYSPDGSQAILSWNEDGYLRLSDSTGSLKWISREDYGGFSTSFKKTSLSGIFEKGKWSVKDRLIMKDGEVYTPKRKPIFGAAKGLGFKESAIKAFWWNGLNVEERDFIDDIGGEIIDYAVTEERVLILSSPLLGIKAKNILKGESPLGVMLYIFSTKGR